MKKTLTISLVLGASLLVAASAWAWGGYGMGGGWGGHMWGPGYQATGNWANCPGPAYNSPNNYPSNNQGYVGRPGPRYMPGPGYHWAPENSGVYPNQVPGRTAPPAPAPGR